LSKTTLRSLQERPYPVKSAFCVSKDIHVDVPGPVLKCLHAHTQSHKTLFCCRIPYYNHSYARHVDIESDINSHLNNTRNFVSKPHSVSVLDKNKPEPLGLTNQPSVDVKTEPKSVDVIPPKSLVGQQNISDIK